jgi:hypothetical protein
VPITPDACAPQLMRRSTTYHVRTVREHVRPDLNAIFADYKPICVGTAHLRDQALTPSSDGIGRDSHVLALEILAAGPA